MLPGDDSCVKSSRMAGVKREPAQTGESDAGAAKWTDALGSFFRGSYISGKERSCAGAIRSRGGMMGRPRDAQDYGAGAER
jgi:hypothetical protein